MTARFLAVACFLAACGGSPEEPVVADAEVASEPPKADVPVPPVPQESPPVIKRTSSGDVPPVVLVWTGIGDLHKGFFTTQDIVTALTFALDGTVAPPANVHIRFDSRWHKGWIQLQLRPGTLKLKVGGEGDVIRLQDLSPIMQGLATYRSTVSARYDMRVESFHVGIESYRGPMRCVFGVGGLPPPDGKTVSNCVEINGQSHCGEQEPGGFRFTSEVAAKIRDCLN